MYFIVVFLMRILCSELYLFTFSLSYGVVCCNCSFWFNFDVRLEDVYAGQIWFGVQESFVRLFCRRRLYLQRCKMPTPIHRWCYSLLPSGYYRFVSRVSGQKGTSPLHTSPYIAACSFARPYRMQHLNWCFCYASQPSLLFRSKLNSLTSSHTAAPRALEADLPRPSQHQHLHLQ